MELEWDRIIGLGCLFGFLITGTYVMYACSILDILLRCCGKEYDVKIIDKDSKTRYDVGEEAQTSYYFKVQYVQDDKYKVNTRIRVQSDEYSTYNEQIKIGYLSCFPSIKRLKSGKSVSNICGFKDDKFWNVVGAHCFVIGWFVCWIWLGYARLAGYIGIISTIAWSFIWWICCCCSCWIYMAQKESQETFTNINNGSQATKTDDPENPEEPKNSQKMTDDKQPEDTASANA